MNRILNLFLMMIFLMAPMWVAGQEKSVTGKIVDESGLPLPGVTILVEGTNTGTVTDMDGNYQLNLSEGQNILVISSVGFKSQRVQVDGRSVINLQMEPDVVGLDEVVVVGYGTTRKSDVTGAVSKVSGESLQQIATTDVVQTLQGKVAGVDVIANSGEPGAGVQIRVRGVGSWGNSSPIYVVDGFPTDDLSGVDPSNIESVEVLKDASATAIYGSRGANGVVLVTTKEGKKGEAVIEASAYAGVQYSDSEIEMTNATDFSILRKEAYQNGGQTIPSDEAAILDFVIANKYKGTNWQDELLNPAPIQNYSVSARGGNDKLSYNVGSTLFMQEGLIDNSGMDKMFLWVNNQYALSEKVSLSSKISYTTYKKNVHNQDAYSGALPVALRMDPITPAWDEETNNYGVRFMGGVVITNPALVVDQAENQTRGEHKLVGNFSLDVEDIFTKGLSLKTMFAADLKFYKNKNYYPEFYLAPDQFRAQSELYEQRGKGFSWVWNAYANYNRNFGDHRLNLMAGSEAQEFNWDDIWGKAFDVPASTDLMYLGQAKNKELRDLGGGASKYTLLSYFSRVNYSYKNRYLLTATYRADGSSKFLGDNKWGYFPSFSLGWNLKEEAFMQDVTFLDQLKLRAGWGQVGNQGSIGNFAYVTTMTTGYNYVIGNKIVDGAVAKKTANPNIKWETSEQINVGVDVSILNQRLDFSADYYEKKTKDLLLDKPIPFYVGAQRPTVNAGTMKNNGFDFSLNWRDRSAGDFSYAVGLNVSLVKNEVTNLAGGEPFAGGSVPKLGSTTRTEEGYELAYFYGLLTDGIINTQEELDAYKAEIPNSRAMLGDVKFVYYNNYDKID